MRRKQHKRDEDFPVTPCPCPHCGSISDRVSCSRDGEPPVPNDSVTICIHCAGPSMLTERLTLRKMTEADVMQFIMTAPPEEVAEYHKMVTAINVLHSHYPEAKRERK